LLSRSPHGVLPTRQALTQPLFVLVILFLLAATGFALFEGNASATRASGKNLEVYIGDGEDMYPDLEAAFEDVEDEDYELLTFYLNPGVYETSLLFYDPVMIVGSDPRTTVLIPDSSTPIIRLRETECSISGISFKGSTAWNTTAVDGSAVSELKVMDTMFQDLSVGIDVSDSNHIDLHNVSFSFCGDGMIAEECENITLLDCSFSYVGCALDINNGNNIYLDQTEVTTGVGDGVRLSNSTNFGVQLCRFSCAGTAFVLRSCDMVEIGYSHITNCHTGFNITDGSSNVTVAINEISWCSGYGVYTEDCYRNLFALNNFFNNSVHAYDSGNNSWNVSRRSGGGNHWGGFNTTDSGLGDGKKGDGFSDFQFNITGGDNRDENPLLYPVPIKKPTEAEKNIPGLIDLIFSIPSLGAAVLSIVLGVYVLQKNSKSASNRVFFLLMMGCFIWGGGEFIHRITNGGLWFIFSNLGLLLIPPALFHFTFVYPNDVLKGKMIRYAFLGVYVPVITLAIALIILIGPLFALLILGIILFFFLFVIAALIRIVSIYIRAKDELTKMQAIYLTIGLIIILLIISGELVIGSLMGKNWFILIADSMIIFFLAMFFAIAVLRYRLVDVEIIFKKSAFYSSMSIILGSFFLIFTELLEASFATLNAFVPAFQSLPDQALSLIAAFMVVLAIAPARMLIKKFLDRLFPQSRKFDKEYVERLEAYEQTLRGMWADGMISDREREALTTLRKKLDLNQADHDDLEGKITQEMKKRH